MNLQIVMALLIVSFLLTIFSLFVFPLIIDIFCDLLEYGFFRFILVFLLFFSMLLIIIL